LTERGHKGHLFLSRDHELLNNNNSGLIQIRNSNEFFIHYYVSEKVLDEVSQLTPLLSDGELHIRFSLDPEKDGLESEFHLKNIKLEYTRTSLVLSEDDAVDESAGISKDIESIKSSLNRLPKLIGMVEILLGIVISYGVIVLVKEFTTR
jgi:hypothetical protein